jgi:dTDP-4-dehydrorhamnose 3,5-epimerase-like enzyme
LNEKPSLKKGNRYADERGVIYFNNKLNLSEVKRIYFIENKDISFKRGWQGHKIEQRWFSAVQGSFKINAIAIDNWEMPSKNLLTKTFILNSTALDALYIPSGYVTSIQALEENAKLMAMTDHRIDEINDEYRFDSNYFLNN